MSCYSRVVKVWDRRIQILVQRYGRWVPIFVQDNFTLRYDRIPIETQTIHWTSSTTARTNLTTQSRPISKTSPQLLHNWEPRELTTFLWFVKDWILQYSDILIQCSESSTILSQNNYESSRTIRQYLCIENKIVPFGIHPILLNKTNGRGSSWIIDVALCVRFT